jgi:predicted amidohydrolase YtcJ
LPAPLAQTCSTVRADAGGGALHAPADAVYRNGFIYTVDADDSVCEALAIRAGRIVYVGSDAGLVPLVGANTQTIDLHGRMLMPGLADGHMHPLDGGAALLKCNLNYLQLSVGAMQAKLQQCLYETRSREPDGWLEVVNWFQEGMVPRGTVATKAVLDALKTQRPIFVLSSYAHTALVNSRALEIAGVDAATRAPAGGKIGHDPAGNPSGIFEDAAQELVRRHLPTPTPTDDIEAAKAALTAMRAQGITTFLDARAEPPSLAAFSSIERRGGLTARAHFAVLIRPPEAADPERAAARVAALAHTYDQGDVDVAPKLTVRNFKLFLDGVISAPELTGAMLKPYFTPSGTGANRVWIPSKNRGPDVNFPAPVLSALLIALASAGFEPHMHADGDRAVREGLDGIQALRAHFPSADIRAALAHDEVVDPEDFPRFQQLNVTPILSFQWDEPGPETIESAHYLGPTRFKYLEPEAVLAAQGARIAYGSDWPVDPLDEWFALQIGVTRANAPGAAHRYSGRLSQDAGLTRAQVLRAITLNSSYELHQDASTGSLEVSKLADFIVLDRNVLRIPVEEIARVKVLRTVVGGQVVYDTGDIAR